MIEPKAIVCCEEPRAGGVKKSRYVEDLEQKGKSSYCEDCLSVMACPGNCMCECLCIHRPTERQAAALTLGVFCLAIAIPVTVGIIFL
jgi:hypothetical protein